jgi:hypothetical protein
VNKDATFFFLLSFVVIGLAWGPIKNPNKNSASQSFFPLGNTTVSTQEPDKSDPLRSPYAGKVAVSGLTSVNYEDPNQETMTLYTNLGENEEVDITGWYFRSEYTGNQAVIGGAVMLPFPNKGRESDVVLKQGDKVYISKGYSPIGISFRANKCTGYFNEDRAFYPSLELDCPDPSEEKIPQFSNNEESQDACLDAIQGVPNCSTRGSSYTRTLPDTVPSACKKYIENNINYDTCVARHYSDKDFAGNTYYLYFKSFAHLWRNYDKKDKIVLYDRNNLIVDTITY